VADPVSGAYDTVRGAGFSNPTSARKMVLVSMFGLLVIAVFRARQPDTDVHLFRRLWGVGVLGLMLSVMADFAPTLAGPFALLTLLGAFTNGGDKAIQNFLSGLSGSSGGSSAPAARTPTRTPAAAGRSATPRPGR
jgi:hypothetical protein